MLVHPVAVTRAGIGVSIAPVHRFNAHSDGADIGAALRSSLEHGVSVAVPEGWKEHADLGRAFLRAAHLRSWKQLQTGSVSCWVRSDGSQIELTPLRNGGTSGPEKGFQPFGAAPIALAADASDAELGTALLEALTRSC